MAAAALTRIGEMLTVGRLALLARQPTCCRADEHIARAMPSRNQSVTAPSSESRRDGISGILARLLRVCLRAQWLVGGACALAAIAYPQVEVYGCIFGAFLNAFLSKALKRIIRQERPRELHQSDAHPSAADAAVQLAKLATSGIAASAIDTGVFVADELGVSHPSPTPALHALPVPMRPDDLGHGMPSSHAMSLCYFASYISVASSEVHLSTAHYDARGSHPHPFVLVLRRLLPDWIEHEWDTGVGHTVFVGVLLALVSIECYTRVRRRLHTWAQILVGGVLGAVVGVTHFRHVMPLIRDACVDVSPLEQRSPTFIACLTLGMVAVSMLTLERNTQRVAKNLVRRLTTSMQRKKLS